MIREIRYALRMLLKTPGFTAVVLITLALGIGANTAIFTFINALLLRPLPYERSGELVEMSEAVRSSRVPVDYQDYLDWKSQARVFRDMAYSASLPRTVAVGGAAEHADVACASGNFFDVLGVRPSLGRALTVRDDQPGAARVVLLSHAFWQSRFGGDPAVVGGTMLLDSTPHTIIGVLPAWFRYHRPAVAWTATGPVRDRFGMNARGNHNNGYVIARLAPGVALPEARSRMGTVARRLAAEYPATNTGMGVAVRPFRELLSGGVRKTALVLLGAVALVLLIACANVANLLLARAASQRREIAMRAALGASRGAIMRQLLVESLLLAGSGSVLGLLVAAGGIRVLAALLPAGFDASDLRIDAPVLAFTATVAVLTGLLFGAMPALGATRVDLAEAMKQSGKGAGQTARNRLRHALIVAEVSVAMVLLVGAGLLIESFWRLTRVDAGFQPSRVVTMEVSWPYEQLSSIPRMASFYRRAFDRIDTLPGVQAAGGVWVLPLSGSSAHIPVYRGDRPVPPRGQFPQCGYHAATPGYFRAAGIPLLRGRLFTEADGTARPVASIAELRAVWAASVYKAVISQVMARRYWPGEDPIGKRFRFGTPEIGGPWMEIVGIVGDVRHFSLDREPAPEFYFSAYQEPRDLTFVIRSGGDPAALVSAVRRVVKDLDPNVPVSNVRSMEEVVASTVAPRRTNMLLLAAFAALALVLAAVGIYGVVSHAVSSRIHEFGIRMALGAEPRDVRRSVLRQAGVLACAGCLIGIPLALALSRLVASFLYGVRPTSPLTYAGTALLLVAVALVAAFVPARRATRVDPLTALRYE